MNSEKLLETFIDSCQTRIEAQLGNWLPPADRLPERLHQAMRYSALEGGKRMRPILTYATGEALDIPLHQLDAPACAVEFIHVYSLVHDDLPAMDDDDLRRGKPTCHVAFDEATAILVGDGLQTLAFTVLTKDTAMAVSAEKRIEMIQALTEASGSYGMVGGQAIDLAAVGQPLDLLALENMHIHKTGALIRASVQLAALVAVDLDKDQFKRLDHYAKCIGLSFQIRDDILDEESDTQTLGKTQGKDRDHNKPNYPALLGLSGAKQKAATLHEEALESLAIFGERAELLRRLSAYIIHRHH